MLGTTADCDEGLDITKMVSVINNNYFDGNRQEKKKSVITPKIFNNFMSDQAADTYYVYDYKLINQASEISNKMGLLVHSNFGINATGLPASLTIEINPQLCLNWEKIDGVTSKGVPTNARYLALVGPGINRNQNDNPPENGKYIESKTKKNALIDVNVQSDDDAEMARNSASNKQFDIKPPLLAAENPAEKITLQDIKQENQGESAWTGEGWRNPSGFENVTADNGGNIAGLEEGINGIGTESNPIELENVVVTASFNKSEVLNDDTDIEHLMLEDMPNWMMRPLEE